MRLARIITITLLATMAIGLAGCTSGPEKTWDSFLGAVEDNRADDALAYIDFTRMAEIYSAEDEEIAASAEYVGGAEGLGKLVEEELRSAISGGSFSFDTSGASVREAAVVDTTVDGDTAIITLDFSGEEGRVRLELIDNEWMIVAFE